MLHRDNDVLYVKITSSINLPSPVVIQRASTHINVPTLVDLLAIEQIKRLAQHATTDSGYELNSEGGTEGDQTHTRRLS